MKTHLLRSARRAFITAKAAIVLAVIAGGTGVLAYEWHNAHPGSSGHHAGGGGHSHHKKSKTAESN